MLMSSFPFPSLTHMLVCRHEGYECSMSSVWKAFSGLDYARSFISLGKKNIDEGYAFTMCMNFSFLFNFILICFFIYLSRFYYSDMRYEG